MADFDFPGGIYPPECKAISNQVPLAQAPLPHQVVLPLTQHVGLAAEPIVSVGQRVRTGEPVARAQGMISAPVHASITGTVSAIEERAVPHPSAAVGEYRDLCIVIDGEEADDWLRMPGLDWQTCPEETLLERLQESGVVGLGGAGFPTAVKAQVRQRHAIDTLIVNAAECEPYITADDLALRTYAEDILDGARLFARLCAAERILIGIENNKPEAIDTLRMTLREALSTADNSDIPIELRVIETRYPSGGEKQLVQRLTGREVPSRGLPADVGVLCHNPGTLLAALRAVRDGEPLISRIVTLTGEALVRPGNVEARLGTPLHDLLSFANVRADQVARLILGGPMMGYTLDSDTLPLVKTANCLIAGTDEEFPPTPIERPCIRCGTCELVCPASLLPQQLYWFARGREHDKAELFNLFDCIECGACAYVCPSHIPLVQYYRASKGEIRAHGQEARRAEHARHRFEFRQARMARAEAEKEAKRQARLQQARIARNSPPAQTTATAPVSPPSQDTSPTDAPKPADVKKLKIAQAAAKAAVKKAEKALARASETGQDPSIDIDDLETQLATARENLQAAEARLAANQPQATEKSSDETSASPRAVSPSTQTEASKRLRQCKIAVASAQAAQRKADKAVAALPSGSDEDALAAARQKAERAQSNLERAQKALHEAEQAVTAANEEKDSPTP